MPSAEAPSRRESFAAPGVQLSSAVSGIDASTAFAGQNYGSSSAFSSGLSSGLSSGYLTGSNEEYSASALDVRRAAQAYTGTSPGTMLVPYGPGTGISLHI